MLTTFKPIPLKQIFHQIRCFFTLFNTFSSQLLLFIIYLTYFSNQSTMQEFSITSVSKYLFLWNYLLDNKKADKAFICTIIENLIL